MDFKGKYISTSENTLKADATKIVLGDDAYAICELIDSLIKEIRRKK